MRIGILTDFPSMSVQSGPAIHTQFLKRGLEKRNHECVLMGPDTGSDAQMEDSSEYHLYPGVSWPTHTRVKFALPMTPVSHLWNPPELDLMHCQTNTWMSEYGAWIRKMYGVPLLNTHTCHMPTHSHFILSDKLFNNTLVRGQVERAAMKQELRFAQHYNEGDCLIVQNRFYVDYWRERGVTIPIEVVGRPIDPAKFSAQPGHDPYPVGFAAGGRMVVVCRHDREKRLNHLIDIFANHIARENPEATLTLVGDGHDHQNLVEQAQRTPFANRIHFPGEISHGALVDWYAHGDIFVYTSLSETFGNVVNEALWCGLPVVALDDRMGVAHQVAHEVNGFLIAPDKSNTDEAFAAACVLLSRSATLRQQMGEQGANLSRASSKPEIVIGRFEAIYEAALEHRKTVLPKLLKDQSRLKQIRAFAKHIGSWAYWNGCSPICI